MSSRKPGYLIGVVLLALVLSAPQLFIGFQLAVQAYQFRSWVLPPLPGFGGAYQYQNLLSSVTFWQDKFVYVIYHSHNPATAVFDWKFAAIDPETGESETGEYSSPDLSLSGISGLHLMSYGDRLWLSDNGPKASSVEMVDGVAQPAQFVMPRAWPHESQRFLWNGQPAYIEKKGQDFTVSTLKAGAWVSAGDVVLPSSQRDWSIGKTWVNFGQAEFMTCLNQGDRLHVFLYVGGFVLYREGLDLRPSEKDFNSLVKAVVKGRLDARSAGGILANMPASALRAANVETTPEGWSLVHGHSASWGASPHLQKGGQMLVGGQPATLIVKGLDTGKPVGHLYRFDGTKWSESLTQAFPFGTNQVRAVTCRDGEKSYLVASTATGTAHVYAVETSGIRKTNGAAPRMSLAVQQLVGYGMVPCFTLVLGMLLGLGVWFLMWWYTRPDYGYGIQNVKLASLGRRGFARLIDFALIGLTTAGLGWSMTRGLDWLALLEAINLHVAHPTVPIAARAASILALWLAIVVLSLLIAQGRTGLTPGKWLCGLRTLRTTLKPCGFARSLARELVFCVDACHFLCWAPGIVSIALTDCRQRLGDLVADTLVVEVRSLT